MAISYTDNFSFPLLDTGSDGWDAVMNGMLVNLDRLLAETRNPLIWESSIVWEFDVEEFLTYDGEVLFYI